jgi:hypothetical protein
MTEIERIQKEAARKLDEAARSAGQPYSGDTQAGKTAQEGECLIYKGSLPRPMGRGPIIYLSGEGGNRTVPEPGNYVFLILKEEPRQISRSAFTLRDKYGWTGIADFGDFFLSDHFKDFGRVRAADNQQCAEVRAAIMRVEEREQLAAQARNQALARAAEAERQAKRAAEEERQRAESRSVLFPLVREFLAACNDGRYSHAREMISRDLDQRLALLGGIKTVCDRNTDDGTLVSVRFVREELRGEGGKVYFMYTTKKVPSERPQDASFIRESGRWKVVE